MDVHGIPVRLVGDGIDWPAWVQAIGSLVALAIAILLPWNDRRIARRNALEDRLDVVSFQHAESGMLALVLSFKPEKSHSGLVAKIRVLEPADAVLLRAERKLVFENAGVPFLKVVVEGIEPARRTAEIRLRWAYGDPEDGGRRGALLVANGADGAEPERAKIDVAIWSTAENKKLIGRRFWVGGDI